MKTLPKSWPLLAALDELLAREGWQEDERYESPLIAMERKIAVETGIGQTGDGWVELLAHEWTIERYLDEARYCSGVHREPDGEPFLRSRDAAAMLEEAVMSHRTDPRNEWRVLYLGHTKLKHQVVIEGLPPESFYSVEATTEAAARTRAALEAGWRLGLWPIKT